MLTYQIICSVTFFASAIPVDSRISYCLEPVNSNVGYSVLALTLYELAPWIFLLVTLLGICRLFRRDSDDETSDADNEPDWYRQQDDSYEGFDEGDDEFVEEEE